jgi:hypothetical protein
VGLLGQARKTAVEEGMGRRGMVGEFHWKKIKSVLIFEFK